MKKDYYTIERLYAEGLISSKEDIIGDGSPSKLLNLLVKKYGYLLNGNPDNLLSEKEQKFREKFTKLIKILGPLALNNKQVIENRYNLKNENDTRLDPGIEVPDRSVIWMPNHGFKDDPLATALAISRNAYYIFASLPQFYNSLDGFLAATYGVVMMNRKVAQSRKNMIPNAVYTLQKGKDIILYPEAVLNKSMNKLALNLYKGIYVVCQETGAPIIPVIHYLRDMGPKTLKRKLYPTADDIIHTVIDDPIYINDLNEKQALDYLRDVIASWFYLLMERYGKDTRSAVLEDYRDINEAWLAHLEKLKSTMAFYDSSIETTADFRPKDYVNPEDAFEAIANLDILDKNGNIRLNICQDVAYAKKLVRQRQIEDFQRRI